MQSYTRFDAVALLLCRLDNSFPNRSSDRNLLIFRCLRVTRITYLEGWVKSRTSLLFIQSEVYRLDLFDFRN
jgi:hypothetical protein